MTTITASRVSRQAAQRRRPTILAWVAAAVAIRRQRAQLAGLSPERLDDLGLSAREARTEANRPFWDVPQHWLR